jgi:chemotaxis protein methyltransferase CheR
MNESDQRPALARHSAFDGREFAFTTRDFKRIAAIFEHDAGIVLSDVKAPLVYSRLVKRLRVLGLESFNAYCGLVESQDGTAERGRMIGALTTNVTRFFREPHHFDHLRQRVLPPLAVKVRAGAPLRIWSAGCSSGEEPYSIALTVLAVIPDATKYDVKILATDINKEVLAAGREGAYPEAVVSHLTRQQRADWFTMTRDAGGEKLWHAGEALRSLVAFRELNLMAEWPMKQAYQAIFCRNVAIYFEDGAQTQIWHRLAGQLAPGGCLYVGHSERVNGATEKFRLDGCTTYRLAGGSAGRKHTNQADDFAETSNA